MSERKLSEAQRQILAAFKREPGEGWLMNEHVAQICGKGTNRSWASTKMPKLRDLGLIEVSGDRMWRRITPAGREALAKASA